MPAIAHQNKILGNTSGGGSTILVTTSESTLYGQTVTLSDGTTTLTGTFSNAGECEFTGVMMVGTLTATSGTASTSINVPYFGVYSIILSLFSATITATYPEDKGATCTCTGNGESYTASGSPYTFTVHGAGEYRVTATLDGKSITDVIQITTDGQSETATINFGTIVVTYDNAFRGLSITCTKDSSVYTKTAPSSGNTMYFYPNITGNWVISGTVSGTSYSKTANVTSLSTSVSVSLETVPDGKTTTPTDDIEKWLQCGQITGKSYTTLSQVLDDAETYERLLADSNACDYMARSTTWASTICADSDAMMRLGKYDYACYVLRANNTWNTAINNSSYSSYIPANPTGQTDIIVTAHGGDTVYYMENGSPVPLTTADRDTGIGTVDWSDLPKGAITLYSSTAKNPSDLTADYSKTVYITEYTTQIYLMPDNALYWYGSKTNAFQECNSTNGWSVYGTAVSPTYNTLNMAVSPASGTSCFIGYPDALDDVTFYCIGKCTSSQVRIISYATKTVYTAQGPADSTIITSATKAKYSLSVSSPSYISVGELNNIGAGSFDAVWYE